jgi:threonine/homoserine/homoserine lactone efflux protein
VVAGIVLSVGNPYFLVWWATVGAALILRSVAFGVWGLVAFGLLHWLCDFVWSYFLSALSFKGGQFFGQWFQRAIFLVCGGMLLFFGVRLVIDGIGALV